MSSVRNVACLLFVNMAVLASYAHASSVLSVTPPNPTILSGGFVNFTIDLLNSGPASAANVVVTDPTPAGLTFVSNSGACTTAFPCNLGTLTVGQTARINARYSVTATSGNVTNAASVTSSTNDPNAAKVAVSGF